MKKIKREYRSRRIYFYQYATDRLAHWQMGDIHADASKDIEWFSTPRFHQFLTDGRLNDMENFGKYIKENIRGARLVYDMLLISYGIEFESDSARSWFMLQYA
jgi:hypothetical protein